MTLLLQMFVEWDSGGAFLREGKRQFSVLNVLITTEANLNIKKKKKACARVHITMEQKPTPIYEHGFHFWRQLHTHTYGFLTTAYTFLKLQWWCKCVNTTQSPLFELSYTSVCKHLWLCFFSYIRTDFKSQFPKDGLSLGWHYKHISKWIYLEKAA